MRGLPFSNSKDNTRRIANVVLMAAEPFGTVNLSHHVLDLDRFDGDVIGQLIVQATTSRGSEGILCGGISRTTPDVSPTEKKLRIRRQPRMPQVKPRAEHVGQ